MQYGNKIGKRNHRTRLIFPLQKDKKICECRIMSNGTVLNDDLSNYMNALLSLSKQNS